MLTKNREKQRTTHDMHVSLFLKEKWCLDKKKKNHLYNTSNRNE